SPAPASPVTTVRAICSCISASLACISWAFFIMPAMSPRPPRPPRPLNIAISFCSFPRYGACGSGARFRPPPPPSFLERVPVVVDLRLRFRQGLGRRLCGKVLGPADGGDRRAREGGEDGLNQRVALGF